MSLAPIPSRMLHDTVTLKVCTGMDRYQEKTYDDYTISNVHLQSNNDTIKRANDTEVQLKGILFVDGRKSMPAYDLNVACRMYRRQGCTTTSLVWYEVRRWLL